MFRPFNFKFGAESEIFGITDEKDLNDALDVILTLVKKIEDSDLFEDGYTDETKAKIAEIQKLFNEIQKQ